jgi:hypothetical protein
MRSLSRVVLAVCLALALPRAAAADGPAKADVDAADRLYTAAKAAMDRGDLEVACPKFAESQRLDPAVGTLLNLGECEARSGKLAAALSHFQAARAFLTAGDYRIAFADDKIAQLTRQLGAQTNASHEPAAPPPPAREPSPSDVGHGGSPLRTVGYVALGAGGVSFVVGVVFGVVAKLTYDSASSSANCPSGTASCNATGVSGGQTAEAQAAVATGTIAAGLVVAAGGLALVLLAPKSGPVAVAPTVAAHGGGLCLGGVF